MTIRQGTSVLWCCRLLLGAVALIASVTAQGRIEVASIQEDRTNLEFPLLHREFSPGRLTVAHLRVEDLVTFAVGVESVLRDRLIVGWPTTGIKDKRFDISAKLTTAETLTTEEERTVVRELLATRFGFKSHIEQRTMDAYRVRLAKPGVLGPGLVQVNCFVTPRPKACRSTEYDPGKGLVRYGGWGNVQQLIRTLESHSGYGFGRRRPVIDATRLQGQYAWSFPPPRGDLGILREHLGLVFESAKASVDVVVIDDVRMPTPN